MTKLNYFFFILLTSKLLFIHIDVFAKQVSENFTDRSVYEIWLDSFEDVYTNKENVTYDSPLYDLLSEAFFDIYQETGNSHFLNFALHEAGRNQRAQILSELSTQEKVSQESLINKLEHRFTDQDYYRIKSFSPEDIYRFHRVEIPTEYEDQAKLLLDYWLKELHNQYNTDSLKASLMAQSLVYGYYLLDDYEKVHHVGRYLIDSHPFLSTSFTVELFTYIAFSSRLSGYYLQSLKIYEDILLPISEVLGDLESYTSLQINYAATLFRIGSVNSALREYESIFENIDLLTDNRQRSALLNNLAISYLNTGQFDRYVEFQLNAYGVAREEDNYGQQLSILRNLFIFYRRQNETDLAVNYLHRALELSQENELANETASILLSLGIYKKNIEENPEEALEHFKEAKKLAEETNIFHHFYNSLVELGETYFILEDLPNAVKHLEEAIYLSEIRGDNSGLIQASMRLANIYTNVGNFEKAKEISERFSENNLQQLPFNMRVLANNAFVKILHHESNYEEAKTRSAQMITEITAWLRESIDHQTGHMRMDEEFSEAFRLHSLTLFNTDDYEQALSATGELRNISRSGFYNNPLLKSKILSEEQLIQDYNLSNRIRTLRSQYSDAGEEQKIYLGNELLEAITERNNLQNRAFPGFSDISYNASLSNVQHNLNRDQIVIYMSVFDEQIFRYTITHSRIEMKTFPNEPHQLNLVRNTLNSLDYGKTDLYLLHEVYQTFFEDVISDKFNHIYFIPDDEFYRLPIGILPTERVNSARSYGSAQYLLEDFSISYLNTLSEFDLNHLHGTNDDIEYAHDLAGFGIHNFSSAGHPELQNLPYSPNEIKQSGNMLNKFSNNVYYLDNESTESNFRKIAGKSKILHLATHSKVNDENPLFSTLYFHKKSETEGQENGIIYAYELFDMKINSEMVFLSSCESGAGGYLKGTGILGFSRAFSYAGAKSLSLNLWPIRDQTAATLSTNFYSALNTGMNKAEAIQESALYYLNNRNSDPYLWGSLVLYGNIESPFQKEKKGGYLLLFGSLISISLLILLVLLWKYRNQNKRINT